MLIRQPRSHPPPRSPVQKSNLYQERLIHLLERTGLLRYRRGDRRNADWTALEFFDNGRKDAVIHFIETVLVDIERSERMLGDAEIDDPVAEDLCKIPHPA